MILAQLKLWALRFIRRMTKPYLMAAIVLLFLTMVSICYMSLTLSEQSRSHPGGTQHESNDKIRKLLAIMDFNEECQCGKDLKKRIEQALDIKDSAQRELRQIEKKLTDLRKQESELIRTIDELKSNATHEKTNFETLSMKIEQAKFALTELAERNTPELKPPLRLKALPKDNFIGQDNTESVPDCTFGSCFDLSRCSLSSGYPVYFYDNLFVKEEGFGYFSKDPNQGCLYVGTFNDTTMIPKLPEWKGDGRNHLLVDVNVVASLSQINLMHDLSLEKNVLQANKNLGKAMIASSNYFDLAGLKPRIGFDIILPPVKYFEVPSDLWSKLPSLTPVRRKYLLSYQEPLLDENKGLKAVIEEPLNLINDDKTFDKVVINFHCKESQNKKNEMFLCGTFQQRSDLQKKSIFTLILASSKISNIQQRLSEALESGSIPVFICLPKTNCNGFKEYLTFAEVIDWKTAAIFLPAERITELHFLLRSFGDEDLFQYKLQGRQYWLNYLGSWPAIMSGMVNLVRTRIGLPAAPFKEEPSIDIFKEGNFKPKFMDELPVVDPEQPREHLGPLEPPMPSPMFRKNFTSWRNSYHLWNHNFIEASRLPPFDPFELPLPTEAKFHGSSNGYRPINQGEGGTGKEFSQSLGGNYPAEQFTIVMLTYERETVLMESIARLHGLPYLNKVIVVWNGEIPPSPDLRWPDLGDDIPIKVLKTQKNSLNNRFLPFDEIETEAILSLDDDAHLRQDEIIVGFRVWRENREKLAGFPGRFHAWDMEHKTWNYNSNYSCELSMVLTGAAFYSKYYSYLYTYNMPQAIRDKVDEFMNCEDIAMNFLISHETKSPPVKVTSRWTFRCQGCPVTLSEDDSHFQERHKCINFFTQVYGYNPLLYTQYRADSVLFKTRIPQDKQKCFKYV